MNELIELSELERCQHTMTAVKLLTEELQRIDKAARARAEQLMKKGDTLSVRSPIDDSKMSRVNLSEPKAVATVTDPAALDEWLRSKGRVEVKQTVVGTPAAVLAVLLEHADDHDLVRSVEYVPDYVVGELLSLSTAAGEPVDFEKQCGEHAPPGITVSTPDPKLTLTVDKKTGPKAFRAMWDAGLYAPENGILALLGGDTE